MQKMEHQEENILELFKTNPARAWEIVHSRPRHHINKEEFFKELMRRKELVEKRKREEQQNENEKKNEGG